SATRIMVVPLRSATNDRRAPTAVRRRATPHAGARANMDGQSRDSRTAPTGASWPASAVGACLAARGDNRFMACPWTDKIRREKAINRRANAFLCYLVEFSENCRQCRLRCSLFDRQRIGGRADGARDRDRGPDEQELVDAILGAIFGEIRDVEDLAHGQPHD